VKNKPMGAVTLRVCLTGNDTNPTRAGCLSVDDSDAEKRRGS